MAGPTQHKESERLVIGIAGRIGSGKTTVGSYLSSKHGFQYLRYSQVLSEWRTQDPENKSHLQEVGWEVMAGGMQTELNRRLIAKVRPSGDVAVDGLRHSIDDDSLRDAFSPSFRLLFLDCPQELRWERRKDLGKYATLDLFHKADSHPVEKQIESLKQSASLVIPNTGSLQDLHAAVDRAIESFRKAGQL